MKISTKGLYAMRILIDLAMNRDKGYITLTELAERQHISKKYLEQIVPLLGAAGILETVRGNKGGYKLAKEPSGLTVGDVLRLTENTLSPVMCTSASDERCPYSADCTTVSIWDGLNKVINEYLDGITIQDVLNRLEK